MSNFSDPIFIILEFIDGKTLQEFLRKSRSDNNYRNLHGDSQTLTARDLTSYAFQVLHCTVSCKKTNLILDVSLKFGKAWRYQAHFEKASFLLIERFEAIVFFL